MIAKYICPTCGRDSVWHIWLSDCGRNLCENCWHRHSTPFSRIGAFFLNYASSGYGIVKIGKRRIRRHGT